MEVNLRWANEIAAGMSYLHDHDFVHRNLTSSAVLLTSNLRAKIDIFELGNDSEMSTRAMYFNIPWMAPEVIKQEASSKRCDVFSYGTVLWELVTNEVPFEGRSPYIVQRSIVEGERPGIPANVEQYLAMLIQRCWEANPKARPSFTEVLTVLRQRTWSVFEEEEEEEEYEISTDSKPLVKQLQLLHRGDFPTIRVAREIKDNWQKVAEKLEIPAYKTRQIAQLPCSPEEQALAMLKDWLEGGYECEEPVTWDTLIAALMCSGYTTLSKKLARRTVD